MESKIKPIPAFYCCYLLRSTVRHASLYVGSSPHPSRRLAQHNGKVKGGAVRTSRASLRPWEMACIVAGFPSNIAALQFEWAWQNAHLTRHISAEDRISFPVPLIKTNRKTGKTRKKPGRPRTSMVERLSNLHLLLRTTYFSRWPLELCFFSEDVYRAWNSWCGRADAPIRPGIRVSLDLAQREMIEGEFTSAQPPAKRKKIDLIGKGGVEGVDPTFARYQDVIEKGQFLLDKDDHYECDICQGTLSLEEDLFALCIGESCTSMSHVTCLSDKFLQESSESSESSIVPTKGHCPRCSLETAWPDLMRAVSLRVRGDKEVKKLLKKKRTTKAATAVELMDDESDSDDGNDTDAEQPLPSERADEHEGSSDSDDHLSIVSVGLSSPANRRTKLPPTCDSANKRSEIVIEDSEDER